MKKKPESESEDEDEVTTESTDELNRVVFVKAYFHEVWVEKKIWAKSSERIPLFGKLSLPKLKREKKSIRVATSDCEIDGEKLAEDIRGATLALNEQGYEVVSVTPITSGQYSPRFDKSNRSRGLWRNTMRQIGFGFSYTEGAVIVGRSICSVEN